MYKDILQKLTNKVDLSAEDVSEIIADIREDRLTEGQISGFLVALVMKGTTLQETAYFAKAMRENCIPIRPNVKAELMDTCGTGGGLSTYNISTATAVIAAAAGIPVAKHGSRSISSSAGIVRKPGNANLAWRTMVNYRDAARNTTLVAFSDYAVRTRVEFHGFRCARVLKNYEVSALVRKPREGIETRNRPLIHKRVDVCSASAYGLGYLGGSLSRRANHTVYSCLCVHAMPQKSDE